jgi:predicted O-linked N-acetylglucosamine transferase (SPINDLY family)
MGEKKRRQAVAASLDQQLAQARSLHSAGRLAEARVAYLRVTHADPQRAEAWLGLGLLARAAGAAEQMRQLFARAVALAPDALDARVQYAWALQEREDFDAAAVHWRAACALSPDDAVLHESLGIVEQAAGNIDAALAAYELAFVLDPTPARHLKLATAISPIPASRAAIATERARMDSVLDAVLAAAADASGGARTDPFDLRLWTNFYLAYHGENDRDLQVRTAAAYRRVCPSLNYVAAHCLAPEACAGRRIRIGLISNFLRNHSIGRTSRGLFARLPRERFEVTALFIAPAIDDEFSRAIRRDAEHAIDLPRDLARARERIASLQLDILFYQDIGMEPFTYFLAFARLAPVQCVSFGHPDTTGLSTIDAFVSNDLYETDGAQAHYSEPLRLLHGLGSLAYYYRPALPEGAKPRSAFGVPEEGPLYLCPQNLFKVHPDMDDLLAAILRRDPHAVVVFVEGKAGNWTQRLRRRWQQTMPDVQARIVFVPRLPDDDFLRLVALADVMLDTVHFNGMNTSLQAFALGTPVVTLPGEFQRGRHTQAMYRRMGLDDLIARDADDYVGRAVRLANDREHRATVSARILEHCGVLFEDEAVIAEFERFFASVAPRGGA